MKTPLEQLEESTQFYQEAYDNYMLPIEQLIRKSDSEKLDELQRELSVTTINNQN